MIYYTYAFLREDKTPYYIGKGKGNRAYIRRYKGIKPPKDKSRILILKNNLNEEEAFRHEIYMIAVFGRKDLGIGILHNRTNGGDGASGAVRSDETRRKRSESLKGRIFTKEHKKNIGESSKGRIFTEQSRKKMSNSHLGKFVGEKSPWYGKKHTEETKKHLSEVNKGENNPQYGKKCWNDGAVNKFSIECPGDGWILGKKHTEESKKKMSEANKSKNKGRKWWNDGAVNKFSIECPGDGWVPGMK